MPATVSTPIGNAPIVPLVLLGAGLYLAWFGVHYWGSDTRWPSDPVKAVLSGGKVPVPSGQQTASAVAAEIEAAPGGTSSTGAALTGPGVAAGGKAPSHSGNIYSLTDLESLWSSQGGSGQTAFAAANVAMAESSGLATITSPNPDGGVNVGLWQLDTKGVGAGYTIAQLQDPATNARLTVMHTANGTSWAQWANPVVHNGVYVGPKV